MSHCTLEEKLSLLREIEDAAGAHRARFLAAQIPMGIYYSDDQGRTTFSNTWFEKKLGAGEAEFIGDGWLSFVHRDDREEVRLAWADFWSDDWPYEIEYRVIAKSGEVRYFRSRAQKFVNYSGVLCAIGIVEDITSEKQGLKYLGKISLRMFNRAERDRSEIATELHESIGQNLALMKLRIQTGMESVPLAAEILREILEPLEEAFAKINALADRLSPFNVRGVSLQTAIEDLCVQMRRLRQFDIDVHVEDIDTAVPERFAIQVYRIIQETLAGIIKHSDADRIRIRTERTEDVFSILISDNGKQLRSDRRRNDTIDMHIMSERARLIGATLDFLEGHFGGEVTLGIRPRVA